MATLDDVYSLAAGLERSYPAWVRGHLRFRVGQLVYIAFSDDEHTLPALDAAEARELVVDAWRMVVPKKLSRAYDLAHPNGPA